MNLSFAVLRRNGVRGVRVGMIPLREVAVRRSGELGDLKRNYLLFQGFSPLQNTFDLSVRIDHYLKYE